MIRAAWLPIFVGALLLGGCALQVGSQSDEQVDVTGQGLNATPPPPAPTTESANAPGRSGVVNPDKPTPDPWRPTESPDKPTPDPWHPGGGGYHGGSSVTSSTSGTQSGTKR